MKTFSQNVFNSILQQVDMKPRLKKELKFVASASRLLDDWSSYELVSIADRTGDKGVLLLRPEDALYVTPYELSRRIVDSSTGRDRAVICDFCYTWQPGSNAASITFPHADTKHSIRLLCCADLDCSQHVRTATQASVVSRARLREDLTNEDRVERLKQRLVKNIEQLGLKPVVE
ncbi:MAG: hypothetical protein JWP06_364 [Candidatus Saccharibacteria bacterium]|nr:hypothetical protein [Candidatus Saccharibacteria bacterium]